MMSSLVAQILPYQTTVNPGYLFVLIAAIVIIVGLRILNRWLESKKSDKPKKTAHHAPETTEKTYSNHSPLGPDKKDLAYVIKSYGFNKDQADFFTRLCNGNKIRNPSRLLQNQRDFDDFCTYTFNYLQAQPASNPNNEKYKTLLFTIRELVENYKRTSKQLTSTRGLKPGQQFTLTTTKDEQYPSTVLENSQEGLLCAVPRDIFKNELRLALSSRIKVFFYSETGESYQLESKVRKYVSSANETRMVIAHSDSIKALPNRNHVRKALSTPCLFNPVTVANIVNGKHTEHKYFPATKAFEGKILDISAGGCSIVTSTPIPVGEYLQIKCMLDGTNEDSMIAKSVKHHTVEGEDGTVMHIQFAKIPRASMNRIFAFIYNYGERAK